MENCNVYAYSVNKESKSPNNYQSQFSLPSAHELFNDDFAGFEIPKDLELEDFDLSIFDDLFV